MHENFIEDLVRYCGSKRFGVPIDQLTDKQFSEMEQGFVSRPELKNLKRQVEDEINNLKSFGVVSFSKRNDSILMWSHYADSHKGFCIGFHTKIEFRDAKEVYYAENINKHLIFEHFIHGKKKEEFNLLKEWFLTNL